MSKLPVIPEGKFGEDSPEEDSTFSGDWADNYYRVSALLVVCPLTPPRIDLFALEEDVFYEAMEDIPPDETDVFYDAPEHPQKLDYDDQFITSPLFGYCVE